jgi:hypothetical protein
MARGEFNAVILGLIVVGILAVIFLILLAKSSSSGQGLFKGLFALIGIS